MLVTTTASDSAFMYGRKPDWDFSDYPSAAYISAIKPSQTVYHSAVLCNIYKPTTAWKVAYQGALLLRVTDIVNLGCSSSISNLLFLLAYPFKRSILRLCAFPHWLIYILIYFFVFKILIRATSNGVWTSITNRTPTYHTEYPRS